MRSVGDYIVHEDITTTEPNTLCREYVLEFHDDGNVYYNISRVYYNGDYFINFMMSSDEVQYLNALSWASAFFDTIQLNQ